ncbi:MAG TPA: hypothetical protein VNJ53_02450 [Gaiellaceae bacterium]|nr:hypothetical protein [Gaiellaceae bacterium]
MSDRAERAALNESLFREVNERIHEEATQLQTVEEISTYCECAELSCTAHISMTPEEYTAAHADSTHFTVLPGHAAADVEDVVSRHGRYDVVRKRGEAGELAELLDGPP